jgi:hypothetical protein
MEAPLAFDDADVPLQTVRIEPGASSRAQGSRAVSCSVSSRSRARE